MATSVEKPSSQTPPAPPDEAPALTWLVNWIKGHQNLATGLAVAVVAAVGIGWYTIVSRNKVEAAASQRLSQGRLAFEAHNYPLAASELARLVENYSGTRAAAQANLVLAQVRLAQGQTQQAIDLLNRVAPSMGRDYQAQAYSLLGGAYENVLRFKDAATAYEEAAKHAQYPFQRGQNLNDAGRTWATAGDTARALAAYRSVISGTDSTSGLNEAKVRVGELTRGVGTH